MRIDYVEPDREVVIELVEQLLHDSGHRSAPERWQWIRVGSSSLVVLADQVAVRIGRDDESARQMQRSQRLVDRLPRLSFEVPRSLVAPRTHAGVTGVAVIRIPGEPHPPGPADPHVLRALLDEVHAVPLDDLRPFLAPARAFYGGDSWREVLREQVVPLFPESARAQAQNRLDALESLHALAASHQTFNHSDLAGMNIHWRSGRVVGVLDWDLASEDDPAEDLASLANWHGWDLITELAETPTVRRAEVYRDAFPLMIVGFAVLRERPESEVERTLERATAKLLR